MEKKIITIQDITRKDIPEFIEVMVQYEIELNPYFRSTHVWRKLYFDRIIKDAEKGKRYLWWGIIDGSKIGFVNFALFDCWYNPEKKHGAICEFYIFKKFRGCGYGTQLAKLSLRKLEKFKPEFITLSTQYDNQIALCFWQKLGFNIDKYRLIKT